MEGIFCHESTVIKLVALAFVEHAFGVVCVSCAMSHYLVKWADKII